MDILLDDYDRKRKTFREAVAFEVGRGLAMLCVVLIAGAVLMSIPALM